MKHKTKKRIGIVGTILGNDRIWMGLQRSYESYFQYFGTVVIVHPCDPDVMDIDLLVLPGGDDVISTRYDEPPSFFNSKPNPQFEYFDQFILPKYIEAGIPIFGICRGLQTINVHFGGKLIQHIPSHPYSVENRDDLVQTIHRYVDTPDEYLDSQVNQAKLKKLKVNSLHHQGCSPKELSSELVPLYISDDTDVHIIEMLKHKTLPIYAVQYHPEEIYDLPAQLIITNLLNR